MKSQVLTISLIVSIILSPLCCSSQADSDPNRFDYMLRTDWYGVYMQGSKIGFAEMGLDRVTAPVDGWRMRASFTFILNVAGTIDTIGSGETRVYKAPGGELYSSELRLSSPTGDIVAEGKKEADEFIVESVIGGQSIKKVLDYPVGDLDSVLYAEHLVRSGELAVGDSFTVTYFEATPPLTGLVHQNMRVVSMDQYVFNGVPTEVYTFDWLVPEMGVSGKMIMDRDGNQLEVPIGSGMLLKLENRQLARQIDASFDLLSDNIIEPERKIEDPRKLNRLELRISGVTANDFIQTKNQVVTVDYGDTLNVVITRQEVPDKPLDLPIQSSRLQPFLEPGPYVQSADEEIMALAAEIVGDEKNSYEAARKVNRWVFENIEKQFTPDISNALQTLHSKRGDCGEHAALSVALMRAAGIPSRIVAGLVYWPPGDGFGYHAWTETFVGDWIMLDPSWGEDIVNPTHIALARGDIIDQISMVYRALGRIGIEVVAAE
jgi:hypothetical protein